MARPAVAASLDGDDPWSCCCWLASTEGANEGAEPNAEISFSRASKPCTQSDPTIDRSTSSVQGMDAQGYGRWPTEVTPAVAAATGFHSAQAGFRAHRVGGFLQCQLAHFHQLALNVCDQRTTGCPDVLQLDERAGHRILSEARGVMNNSGTVCAGAFEFHTPAASSRPSHACASPPHTPFGMPVSRTRPTLCTSGMRSTQRGQPVSRRQMRAAAERASCLVAPARRSKA